MTTQPYSPEAPTRAEIDAVAGPLVLEFGADWCGYCRAAQSAVADAFAAHPGVAHRKVEDGKGRPLGRSFRVTLWPTLVFLRDGAELARVVRPADAQALRHALALIGPTP